MFSTATIHAGVRTLYREYLQDCQLVLEQHLHVQSSVLKTQPSRAIVSKGGLVPHMKCAAARNTLQIKQPVPASCWISYNSTCHGGVENLHVPPELSGIVPSSLKSSGSWCSSSSCPGRFCCLFKLDSNRSAVLAVSGFRWNSVGC